MDNSPLAHKEILLWNLPTSSAVHRFLLVTIKTPFTHKSLQGGSDLAGRDLICSFSVILEEAHGRAQAWQSSCLPLCRIRDRDVESVPPAGTSVHTQLSTCDRLLLPSPFLCCFCIQQPFRVAGSLTQVMTLIPPHPLATGWKLWLLPLPLCTEAECLVGLVLLSIFILSVTN